jgi:hypothetical protein
MRCMQESQSASSGPPETEASRREDHQKKSSPHLPSVPRQKDQARSMKHRCGDQVCFHGSFTSKAKAKRKAAGVKGSRVKFVKTQGGSRYVVLTKKV